MTTEAGMKKLYRSTQDRKIAGVCGGLGAYFDIDPVFFRLVFLLSILFGGLGALAYLVMWIMVPAQEGARREGSRLRLSATDRKIGGVCGGLGEFFELDPLLFRVAFVVLAFVGGLGILLYVVLWLVVPGSATPLPSGGQPGHT
jgi:phage shock protein PspC (stress-responsive transcriptional regulator)